MLSRTLSVLQSLLFPWNERHHHATPAPPRPRQKRRSVAPTVPAFTKRKTSPVFDTGSPELSPSSFWQISSGPPGYGGPQPHKKRKTLPSLGPGSLELPSPFRRLFPSLDDLNADVFQLVADQLHQQEVSLRNLALSSRKLRSLCFPILFSRCRTDVRSSEREDPPEAIRTYVRHLTHFGPLHKDGDLAYIENLLSKFPHLTSIALEELSGCIPWAVLKACLVLPRLTSLSVHHGLYGLCVPPFPPGDVAVTPISLKHFSYAITTWREKFNGYEYVRGGLSLKDMRPDYDFERKCLSGIVLKLNNTATSLTLPMESAPILAMTELSWPHLRELTLHGRFIDSEHAASLQYLLPSLSSLKKLSILAGRFPLRPLRYPILPSSSIPPSATLQGASIPRPSDPSGCSSLPASSTAPASTNPSAASEHGMSPTPLLSELRSLAIAYPDPEDRLFSLSLPNLRHLSLRDQPRVYHRLTADGLPIVDGPEGVTWPAPLLSPEECLSILRRMDLSLLTSFELVYMAHQPGEDDELLLYIAESLPRLEHLELHRYRGVRSQMRKTRVDHMHIAQLLSTLTSLVTLRLNLDFHDDHQAYCAAPWERERWFPLFKTRGFEIVDLLQASCPHLEHVALLYHGDPAATWAEFHPQRCAEPRFVLDYTKDHVDSEPCPREWVLLDDSVIPTLLTL